MRRIFPRVLLSNTCRAICAGSTPASAMRRQISKVRAETPACRNDPVSVTMPR